MALVDDIRNEIAELIESAEETKGHAENYLRQPDEEEHAEEDRDRWCAEIDAHWPQYGFAAHKGYGTATHLAALQAHGPCTLHRRSFAPVAQAARLHPDRS